MARGEIQQNGMRTGPVFEARFDGNCGAGDTVDEGEEIVMADGEAWHVECAIEDGYQVPGRRS